MGRKTRIINGIPVSDNPADVNQTVGGATQVTSDSSTTSSASDTLITGVNLGVGAGIYAGANGSSHERFEFRSILAGSGISIKTDATTLTITGTGAVSSDLNDLGGILKVELGGTGSNSHSVNSIMLGNGSGPLQSIGVPSQANDVLMWNGSSYTWVQQQEITPSGVQSILVEAGSSKIVASGGTITTTGKVVIDISETNIPINNLQGTLAVSKGGTGTTTFVANSLLTSNGSVLSSTAVPSASGQVLTWDGAKYVWNLAPSGSGSSQIIMATSNKVTIVNSTVSGGIGIDVDQTKLDISQMLGVLPPEKGGTGMTTIGAPNTYLRVASNGLGLEYGTVIATGSVTSVSLISGSNKLSVSGGPITGAGTIMVDITESNLSHANIGGIVPIFKGGTGLSNIGLPNQILKINSAGTGYEFATLTSADTSSLILATVATTGSFTDLTNKPVLSAVSYTGSYTDLVNKPVGGSGTGVEVILLPGSNRVVTSNVQTSTLNTITIDIDDSKIDLNRSISILDIAHGGTGSTTYTENALLVGGPTNITSIAIPDVTDTYLHWDGSAYVWSELTSVDGVPGPQGLKGDTGSVGLTAKGAWVTGTTYNIGDYVISKSSYSSTIDSAWISTSNLAFTSVNHPAVELSKWVEVVGVIGPIGLQGEQGIPGAASSIAGPRGIRGDTGPRGNLGLIPKGRWVYETVYALGDYVIDQSSYNSAVDSAWISTSPEEFISLVRPLDDLITWIEVIGVTGADGPKGEVGEQGLIGLTGVSLTTRGIWITGTIYNPNDMVVSESTIDPLLTSIWVSKNTIPFTSSTKPAIDTVNWLEIIIPKGEDGIDGIDGTKGDIGAVGPTGPLGLTPKGNWLSGTTYVTGDYVIDASFNNPSIKAAWVSSTVDAYVSTKHPYLDMTKWSEMVGTTGAIGPIGIAGPTGPIGPKGLTARGPWVRFSDYVQGDYVVSPSTANPSIDAAWICYSVASFLSSVSPVNEKTKWVELVILQGPIGPQGIVGPVGPTGDQGIQGIKGDLGPKGADSTVRGPQGVQGLKGDLGLITKGIWVGGSTYLLGDYVIDRSSYDIDTPSGWFSKSKLAIVSYTQPYLDSTNWVEMKGITGPQGKAGPVGPPGLISKGTWVSGDSYNIGDYVIYRSSSSAIIDSIWISISSTTFVAVSSPIGNANWLEVLGIVGADGPTGLQGIKGDKGDRGLKGLVSKARWISGTSYDLGDYVIYTSSSNNMLDSVWISISEPSFVSSVAPASNTALWLEMSAPIGPQGPIGLKGDTGPTGAASTVVGPMGPIGYQGATGAVGAVGATGTNGTNGTNGAAGAAGAAGANGSSGIAGINGTNGTKGDPGIQGIQGVIGLTGAGVQGVQGVQGIPGPIGIGLDGETGVKGETGAQGLRGPQGIQGLTGPQGPAGTGGTGDGTGTGAAGPQGPAGVDGIDGAPGVDGIDGAPGAAGAQGGYGPAGSDGRNGAPGAPGSPGVQGPAGTNGFDGETGVKGETGPQGLRGPQGIQGPAGPAGSGTGDGTGGSVGPAGPQGVQGEPGVDGLPGSVGLTGANGTNGTNGLSGADGLAGSDGATGLTGPAGPQGTTGSAGTTGIRGLTGLTGSMGDIGLTGPIGLDGESGVKGETGPQGLRGPQGDSGITGDTGPTGQTGLIGQTGLTGPAGPQGIAGLTGPAGPQGNPGSTGPSGPQGTTGTSGVDGSQGPIGLTGPAGIQGIQGIQGATGASGDITTVSNVGSSGVGLFRQKTNSDLEFKKIIAGDNITVTDNGTSITLDAVAGGSSNVPPAGSVTTGYYYFMATLNPGTAINDGTTPATIGISTYPSGWTFSSTSGVLTVTHTVGRPALQLVMNVATSVSGGIFKVRNGSDAATSGSFQLPSTGTTAMNTTQFNITLNSTSTGGTANGVIHIRVIF